MPKRKKQSSNTDLGKGKKASTPKATTSKAKTKAAKRTRSKTKSRSNASTPAATREPHTNHTVDPKNEMLEAMRLSG